MLSRILPTTAAALLGALLLTAAPTAAQDFDVQVQRDPRANTVTYDFHFQGPPRGHAWMFVSPLIQLPPLPLPGNIGPLFLNPGAFFPVLPPLQLDNLGQLQVPVPLPFGLVDDVPLVFQPAFIDPQNVVFVPPKAKVVVQGGGRPQAPKPEGTAIGYALGSNTVDFRAWGAPGTTMELQIFDDQNRLVDTISATIDQSCSSPTVNKQINAALGKGYTYRVWERQGSTLIPVKTGTLIR